MASDAPAQGLQFAKAALIRATEHWNDFHAQHWHVSVTLDENRFNRFVEISERVFDGEWLPKYPGPFKRLGSYAIGVQYFSPYSWKKHGKDLSVVERQYWEPRITIFTLPYLGGILKLKDGFLDIPINFPTQHSRIEAVAYLRNLFISAQESGTEISIDVLAERITLMGLLIETSSYACHPNTDRLQGISEHAKNCLTFPEGDPRQPDLEFMNLEMLEMATSYGLEQDTSGWTRIGV